MKPRPKTAMAICAVLCAAVVLVGAGASIRGAATGRTYSDASAIPYRRVGLLLGCSERLSDGRNNLFFAYRIAAAASLFRAGKVDYLIVSGDNHEAGYDEATDMKRALERVGVPADRIYCDYAGFRTLDSVVRARKVFGQTSVTIISQEFHNQRAIYIARHEGLDAVGFNARAVDSYNGFRTRVREAFARVKTVLDVRVLRTGPKFLGPMIQVGTAERHGGAGGGAVPSCSGRRGMSGT